MNADGKKLRWWRDKKMRFQATLGGAECLRRSDAEWQILRGANRDKNREISNRLTTRWWGDNGRLLISIANLALKTDQQQTGLTRGSSNHPSVHAIELELAIYNGNKKQENYIVIVKLNTPLEVCKTSGPCGHQLVTNLYTKKYKPTWNVTALHHSWQ